MRMSESALEPEDILPLVYDDLRAIAAVYLARERPDHTFRPTDLVHEAFLRLRTRTGVEYADDRHFLALAATAMRRILVDHARARNAEKRGGGRQHITVDESVALSDDRTEDVLAVHEALERLAAEDPRAARIVELRFFGGLTDDEIAEQVGISSRWVRAEWAHARAWLKRVIDEQN
jgi:RNA polymerase sigma factor (TIGR02999 family)